MGVPLLHGNRLVVDEQLDRRSMRQKCTHNPAARVIQVSCPKVWAEYAKRVTVIAADYRFYLVRGFREFERHRRYYGSVADAMDTFLLNLNKAELHVHLEGSVEPETVAEIDAGVSPEEALHRYRHTDFPGFIRSYIWINRKLQTPDHYGIIARRLVQRLARENVRYAEINLSVGVILWKEQNFAGMFDAVDEAVRAHPEVEVRWIFDAVRQFGAADAWRVAELAVELKERGVCGFGIGGDEAAGPAEWFREVFDYAARNGLIVVPHAGESVGPESVAAALDCGAQRIGHGFRAIEDPGVVRELRDRGVPLEICITSNVCTGSVPSLDAHPVRRLFDAGVNITLNTDDPAIFRTNMLREFLLAAEQFGFTQDELQQVARTAWEARADRLQTVR